MKHTSTHNRHKKSRRHRKSSDTDSSDESDSDESSSLSSSSSSPSSSSDSDNSSTDSEEESTRKSRTRKKMISKSRKPEQKSRKKRKQAKGTDDTSDEDRPDDAFTLIGRYAVRTVYPWVDLKRVVPLGVSFPAGSSRREKAKLSTEQQAMLDMYDKLYDQSEALRDLVARKNSKEINEAIKRMCLGASLMRSYDTRQIKVKVSDAKSDRGFSHNQVGRMLTPLAFIDEYDKDPVVARERIKEAKIRVTGDLVPLFAYQTKNPADILDGLCQGPFVIRTLRHMWTSPSSAMGVPSPQATKQGYAHKLGVDDITPEIISWACVIDRYALSSQTRWPANLEDGDFNYATFFHTVVNLFRANPESAWAKTTLAAVNLAVFGHQSPRTGTGEKGVNSSHHAHMMAAIAATNKTDAPPTDTNAHVSPQPASTSLPAQLPSPPSSSPPPSRSTPSYPPPSASTDKDRTPALMEEAGPALSGEGEESPGRSASLTRLAEESDEAPPPKRSKKTTDPKVSSPEELDNRGKKVKKAKSKNRKSR